jgi:ribose transport system ATP-binding protein
MAPELVAPVRAGTPAALELRCVSKAFAGDKALDNVDLELRSGEIHALLGQNGSGKSTLIKILAGYHQPSPGASASANEQPFELGSPSAARDAGIRFIHQDLGLINEFDIVDNLALGDTYQGRWWLSGRRERAHAREVCAEHGIAVDVTAPLRSYGRAVQTTVAIARALTHEIRGGALLVLDEPTAALPEHDVQHLFGLLREARRRGATILYVTHRMGEVFDIADRVTVLRDGRRVATHPVCALDHHSLVELIVGRSVESFYPETPPSSREPVLEVRDLSGGVLVDVSLQVRRGEIVGVTGLIGSGYDVLLSYIFGGVSRHAGSVTVRGAAVPAGSPRAAIGAGMGYAPADRKRVGAIADWTLRENITLPALRPRGRWPLPWLSDRSERRESAEWVERFGIVPADPQARFAELSGGNQQKAVVARWIRRGAEVLLLDEPTNGVDVGSKHAIYESIAAATAGGTSVLISSSDTEELCALCDRVHVMRRGCVGAVLTGQALTPERVLAESFRDHEPTIKESAVARV